MYSQLNQINLILIDFKSFKSVKKVTLTNPLNIIDSFLKSKLIQQRPIY